MRNAARVAGHAAATLPAPLARWPTALRLGAPAFPAAAADVAAGLARIREETLWWPAPRRSAVRPRALALNAAAFQTARRSFPDAEIRLLRDPAAIDPERLEAVFGPPDAAPSIWATLGGLQTPDALEPAALLAGARGVSPWTGESLALTDAIDAQSLLRRAALRVRGRAGLVAMLAWKRRCLAPFLQGPDGAPRAVSTIAAARRRGLTPVVWGAEPCAGDVLRSEDGFLRSVGLGLRHVPPISLTIGTRPPYFDATRRNGFDALVAEAKIDSALRARARRLAARIVTLGLTKYNLLRSEALPHPQGRAAILVAGQVENDASIRLGARLVRSDLALLEAARARFPEAFLLYKPHPDVVTGLRRGAAPQKAVSHIADATAPHAAAERCLEWADRVVVNTSLLGFEALMRGKSVTTFGRPFYAGWGLTDDADPPPRPRILELDELLAAALILYPSYVDPRTRLPAPPEIAVEALARERALATRLDRRLLRLWRDGASWVLNRW